ncbi:hypothetical protein HN419_03430 [Candidatus Woesearchaeota archaeon]|jgi:hypothetical protein|nr:hypothetical protein [Candidatus Woesearchaeota archaeon]MBT3538071.1 hypothetical protein [Candidatus Woesearchaeota archaeon]MBT4697155.1 hypothetical protein [Candidatus Woesearchaeota archaeon]MBT4717146.1 hypothetical protein [Candidatus Woesearchaeota archaeon]MBT7105740.1 hypothetical protein [Candidatus Woesearchaeota archaeon]
MSVFDRNLNTELLLAIEYMKVSLSANNAVESVLFDISAQKFGRVSRVFSNIIKENKKGKPLDTLLAQKAQSVSNKNFKELLIVLNTESSDIVNRLGEVADHIMNDKKQGITKLYGKLNAYFGKIMIVLVVPMLIYLADILKDAFGMEEAQTLIPENIKLGAIVACAVALVIMMLMMRYTEN